jgi:hypothetical protein
MLVLSDLVLVIVGVEMGNSPKEHTCTSAQKEKK